MHAPGALARFGETLFLKPARGPSAEALKP